MQDWEVAEVTDPRKIRPAVPAEELVAEVNDLMRLAAERGIAARSARGRGAVATTQHPDIPDITELLSDDLRSILEDEVVLTVAPDESGGILDWELEREIVKKALIGLKAERLRKLAVELRLDKRGSRVDLAERIARVYRYDPQEIAQLVLDNEEEPEPERGHADRVFPLAEPNVVEKVVERLTLILGRFVRVGVARWFVFDDLQQQGTRLTLHGTLLTYKTFVSTESETDEAEDAEDADDAVVEVARLNASPSESKVTITMVDGRRALRVQANAVSPARAAARALEAATDVRLLGYVPYTSQSFEGALGTFAPQTIFMLDFVDNRLATAQAMDPNLTVARFEMERDTATTATDEGDRPTLREVRFEGDHLLDSVAACRLIAIDVRALIELSLRVSFTEAEPARFPVRIGLERDHATVLTGFGAQQPTASAALHRNLVRAVERAFDEGVANGKRLESLAERIAAFARANEEAEHATMLKAGDEDDDGDEA